jgi:hypothetical protein
MKNFKYLAARILEHLEQLDKEEIIQISIDATKKRLEERFLTQKYIHHLREKVNAELRKDARGKRCEAYLEKIEKPFEIGYLEFLEVCAVTKKKFTKDRLEKYLSEKHPEINWSGLNKSGQKTKRAIDTKRLFTKLNKQYGALLVERKIKSRQSTSST